MKNTPNNQFVEQAPEFVAAPVIARRLSVTGRYVLQMAEQGRISCVRLSRKCVRFSPAAVAEALGIEWQDAVRPVTQPVLAPCVPDGGISMEAEINDLEINVDPYEANAPSRQSDVELERNLRLIEKTNLERASQ